jgi:hypothetical protein
LLERVVRSVSRALAGRERACERVDVQRDVVEQGGRAWRCTISASSTGPQPLRIAWTRTSVENAVSLTALQLRRDLIAQEAQPALA